MVQIAFKTLQAFDHAVRHDQGNTYRGWLARVLPHMSDAYRQDDAPFRSHMGASGIGDECARKVWYGFRWASVKTFSGQLLRLFNVGHIAEGRFISLMLSAGMGVIQQDANGKQFKIEHAGGHYGGSGDGMVDGCPDLPVGTRALTEFKTHNEKSFAKLAGANWPKYEQRHVLPGGTGPVVAFEGEGVRSAKFEHWVQMQQYMRGMGLAVGLYLAENKNTSHVYAELVPLDAEAADKFTQRAIQIIPMHAPPAKLGNPPSPGLFACKFCDYRPVCHLGAPPARNCRTCEWSEPREDGLWWCTQKDRQMEMLFGPTEGVSEAGEDFSLTKARQLKGCNYWAKNSKAFS